MNLSWNLSFGSICPETERLRAEGFLPPAERHINMTDSFDSFSYQLTLRDDSGDMVGVARLTPRFPLSAISPGLIESWTSGVAPGPPGLAVDVSRIVVSPKHRRKGYYKLLVSLAILEAWQLGAQYVVMVIDVGLPAEGFLKSLGYTIVGGVMQSDDIPGLPPVDVHCVWMDIAANMASVTGCRDQVLSGNIP